MFGALAHVRRSKHGLRTVLESSHKNVLIKFRNDCSQVIEILGADTKQLTQKYIVRVYEIQSHVPVAIEVMKTGIPSRWQVVLLEVGGLQTIPCFEVCNQLVLRANLSRNFINNI